MFTINENQVLFIDFNIKQILSPHKMPFLRVLQLLFRCYHSLKEVLPTVLNYAFPHGILGPNLKHQWWIVCISVVVQLGCSEANDVAGGQRIFHSRPAPTTVDEDRAGLRLVADTPANTAPFLGPVIIYLFNFD